MIVNNIMPNRKELGVRGNNVLTPANDAKRPSMLASVCSWFPFRTE
ncbi:MAG TPA: hypothetical protein VI968_00470 [archaeon]|nr:hypothetical protein [archaeon]